MTSFKKYIESICVIITTVITVSVFAETSRLNANKPLIPENLYIAVRNFRMPEQQDLSRWLMESDEHHIKRIMLFDLLDEYTDTIALIDTLYEFAIRDDTSLRLSAVAALGMYGNDAKNPLMKLLVNGDEGVRHYAFIQFYNNESLRDSLLIEELREFMSQVPEEQRGQARRMIEIIKLNTKLDESDAGDAYQSIEENQIFGVQIDKDSDQSHEPRSEPKSDAKAVDENNGE